MQSTARAPRVIRGLCAATIATFSALVAHVAAGGDAPALSGLAAPLALSLTAGVLLAGRKLSLVRLGLIVTLSQVFFHYLFVLGASGAHAHGAGLAQTGIHAGVAQSGIAMWIGHLSAAAATVYFLHRAEVVIHTLRETAERLAEWLRHRLATFPKIAATPRRLVAPAAHQTWQLASQRYGTAHGRRGPPDVSGFQYPHT